MKHTGSINMCAAPWAVLGMACLAFLPSVAFGGWVGETMCACPGVSRPLGNNATCDEACFGTQNSPGGGPAAPRSDDEAARRTQEAADAAERQRQAEYLRGRDAAAKSLKGSPGPALDQLKGVSNNDGSGLKGSGFDRGSTGLKGLGGGGNSDPKEGLHPAPPTESAPVDGRNVPAGLGKALDNVLGSAYVSAPPGVSDRVRKGFQAVMNRDWNVAKAWFQDALRLDPHNPGLKRLVALAETSLQTQRQTARVDERNEPAGLGGKPVRAGSPAQANRTNPVLTTDPNPQLPDPNDMSLLFPGLETIQDKEAPVFKTLPDGRVLQIPTESDMDLLFDLMYGRQR